MFEVTEKAVEMIKEYLKDQEKPSPIRVLLSEGGWSGPSLGMALDEPRDDDETFDNGGITFVVNNELLDKVKPIKVDFVQTPIGERFFIDSSLQLQKGGGDCGSCSCWIE